MELPTWLAACVNFFTIKSNDMDVSVKKVPLPPWFQGKIPTDLLRLARANREEPLHRQILADWVERYGGEEGRLMCRFFRRDPILRDDASTWQTLSALEARLVAPFSDLVLGIGDRAVLPLTETQSITMGWVPPGQSWLGGGGGNEGTRHFILNKGLWCGIYPVTQEQWQAVMGYNPSHFNDKPKNPVEQVSWNDVQEFLQKVNAANSRSGFLYCLPTADEWEYIIRGGPIPKNQSQYHTYFASSKSDLTVVASNENSSWKANFDGGWRLYVHEKNPNLECTSAVGNYLPNPLGIFDMHGNVWEWTSSEVGSDRVDCGGSWGSNEARCTASSRNEFGQEDCSKYIGFRLVAVPFGE